MKMLDDRFISMAKHDTVGHKREQSAPVRRPDRSRYIPLTYSARSGRSVLLLFRFSRVRTRRAC